MLTTAAVLSLCLLVPAVGQAAEAPPEGVAIFTVPASNGYELMVFAAGDRNADGDGEIALWANSRRAAAIYRAPATVTRNRVEGDLGAIGKVSVKLVATGKKRTVRPPCRKRKKLRVTVPRYEGTIEFHGEEGFSEASASGAPFDWRTYLAFACAREGGRPVGRELPGARLDVHRLPEENELMLHATQLRPRAKTRVGVQVDEVRDGLEITRATGVVAGPDALTYNSGLTLATLAPPAPFDGSATFRANAPRAERWTGDLSVDLPGYSDYPLVGPEIEADLERPRA